MHQCACQWSLAYRSRTGCPKLAAMVSNVPSDRVGTIQTHIKSITKMPHCVLWRVGKLGTTKLGKAPIIGCRTSEQDRAHGIQWFSCLIWGFPCHLLLSFPGKLLPKLCTQSLQYTVHLQARQFIPRCLTVATPFLNWRGHYTALPVVLHWCASVGAGPRPPAHKCSQTPTALSGTTQQYSTRFRQHPCSGLLFDHTHVAGETCWNRIVVQGA